MTAYEIPADLLATIVADAAERDELRQANTSLSAAVQRMATEQHELSQHRLRESERALAAEQRAAALEQELTDAVDARHQLALDLEGMTEARDTLLGELGRESEAAAAEPEDRQPVSWRPIVEPLQPGARVVLVEGSQYSVAPRFSTGVTVGDVDDDDNTVRVRWDHQRPSDATGHWTSLVRLGLEA